MNDIIITKMDTCHADAMAQLELVCFSLPWSLQACRTELANPIGYYLAAQSNGKLAGYAGMQIISGEGYITNIAVSPAFRRHGIAKALLHGLITEAFSRELIFLTLEVRVSNLPAISLYKSFGFEQAGQRKNYYQCPDEDAFIMTLMLEDIQKKGAVH